MPQIIERKDLRRESQEDLISFFQNIGEKKFRANQVREWLWKKSATKIDEMSNLSLEARKILENQYLINPVVIDHSQTSTDGTIKNAFKLHDGHLVEGVLIPTKNRQTACISSQVGCSLSCTFCATGFLDRKRNIEAAEIYDQVVLLNQQSLENSEKPLSNIVYMGMGEPLLNYAEVLKSVDLITSEWGLNMSPKRITISTAGVSKMIKKLGDDEVKFNLALSLHAADDEKRNTIMPINETNSLDQLSDALNHYYEKTGNEITFEYILFYNFNDGLEDAKSLLKFVRKVPSKVNIIEYNPISEANFQNTDPASLDKFQNFLLKNRVKVSVRRSRGKDIDAACGQLANKN